MYIYVITNKLNGKIYIGQTINSVETRFKEHCRKHNTLIDRTIHKYGKENFMFEILDTAETLEQLNELERYYISLSDSTNRDVGYNLCKGGNNTSGYTHRKESREKMSVSRKGLFVGTKNPFYGKHHSEEQILKWKADRKGRVLTEEWKKHLSDTSPFKVRVKCLTTGEYFGSIKEASLKYGIPSTHISRVCRGVRKTCKGLVFAYDNTVPNSDNSEKV